MFKNYQNYEVYEDGRIWSYWTNKFLKPHLDKGGYQRIGLVDNEGIQKWYFVHKVIYEAVTGEPIPSGFEINHIDEDKTNNNFTNLNLLTHKENMNFGTRNSRAGKAISKANTNNPKISKSVGAYRNNELVMLFPSTQEASRQGFNKGNISECCNGKRKTHKGYEWKYINEKET